MTKSFVLFRDGRRLRAAHLDLQSCDAPLLITGRRFEPAGGLYHWSHITDSQKRLLGFVVDSLKDANLSPEWRIWWDSFDNRHSVEFWQAYLFLADPMPTEWHEDSALLVGGWTYADGAGNFAIGIPDMNDYCFRPNEPTEFWKEIGFELTQMDVSVPA